MITKALTLAKRVWQSNCRTLPAPYKLNFIVTKECHSRCLNCSIWKAKPKNELSLDEVKRLSLNSPFLSWIDFTGGEPTDRNDFVEIVETFANNCPDLLLLHFPTNGLKTKRIFQTVAELVKLKIPRLVVTVSIDGPPEVNDRLRGIPGDFARACETYAALLPLRGVSIYAGMTLYKDNMHLVAETIAAIRDRVPSFNSRRLHVNIPNISSHFYGNSEEGKKTAPEMAKTMAEIGRRKSVPLSFFEVVERSYQGHVGQYLESGLCPQDCASLLSSCALAADGTVYPCLLWDEPLGNIRDSGYSLLPLLRAEKAVRARELLLKKQCPNCWTPCEAYQTMFANLIKLKGMQRASHFC